MIVRINLKTKEATIIKPLDDYDRKKIDDIYEQLYRLHMRREKEKRLMELVETS